MYVFLTIPVVIAVAQNGHIDSLLHQLERSQSTSRIEILLKLSDAYLPDSPGNSLNYARESQELAVKNKNKLLLAKSLNNIGKAQYYLNQYEASTQSYFASLTIFDSLKNLPWKAKVLNNIAWNFRLQGEPERAIVYFNDALEIAEALEMPDLQQGIYNNLGTAYRYTNELQKALEVYERSLQLNRQSGNKTWEAYNLNNIGLIYTDLKEFKKSRAHFFEAIKLNEDIANIREYVKNHLNLGYLYTEFDRLDSADMLLEKAHEIIVSKDYETEMQTYYEYKTALLTKKGDYKNALEFQKLYYELDKELYRSALNEKISDIQARYELGQKEKEIAITTEQLKQQRLIIYGGSASFILLFGILTLVLVLYRTKHRHAKNISRLNKEILQKAEQLKKVNTQIQRINNNLENLVEERTEKLNKQNEKLIKYAFINSHEIRGPLARVLGLLYLLGLEQHSLRTNTTFQILEEAAHELDTIIKETSELLIDEDIFVE